MPSHYSDPKVPQGGGKQNRGVGLYISQSKPFKNPGGRKAQQIAKHSITQVKVPKSYSK